MNQPNTRPPDQNGPVLNITGLSYYYPGRPPILDNINLQISKGERVGVIGPNGAGKTTFFMLNCGVIKPTSGMISLYGRPIKAGEFRSEMGMIFQNQDDQLFCPSVRDDIAFGPTNMGLDKKEVEVRVQEAFNAIGIEELAERPPHHLSGGEKRLVAIAGVLAMRPKLVVYDEPTSNLDLRYRRRLIQILKASTQDAILIASHDLEFILEVCNRVILMDKGSVVADGNPAEVMSDQVLMNKHGLEKPHSLVPHTNNHH